MTKVWTGAPFGTSRPRFTADGIHPRNRFPGSYLGSNDNNAELGPGKYNIEDGDTFSSKTLAMKASGPGWARQVEVEGMTALPYLLNKDLWRAHKEMERSMGPGKYNITNTDTKKQASTRGLLDTLEPRLKDTSNNYPGPGTYGYPDCRLMEKKKRPVGKVGLLEGGGGDRQFPSVGSALGPGQYETHAGSGSIECVLNKRCSVRGPYDLFTAERDDPLITGHYATVKSYNLGPGQYDLPSHIKDVDPAGRAHQGKFSKVKRFPRKPVDRIFFSLCQYPREPSEPGPGQYGIPDNTKKPLSQGNINAMPPFNTKSRRDDKQSVKFFTGNHNPVGIGRYDLLKYEEAQHVNGHSSNFQSTVGRPTLQEEKILAERIRPRTGPGEMKPVCSSTVTRPAFWFDQDKPRDRC